MYLSVTVRVNYFETRIYRSSKQLWRHLFNHLRVVGRQRLYQDIINLFFLTNNSKRTLSIPQNTTVLQQRESLFLSFDYCTKSKTRRIWRNSWRMIANFLPNCAAPSFECNTTIDAVLVVSLINAFKFIEHEKVRSPQTGSALLCNRYHVPCFITDGIRPSTRRIKALSGTNLYKIRRLGNLQHVVWIFLFHFWNL